MSPNWFLKHVEVYKQKEEERVKEIDNLNWMLGSYIRTAFNSPGDYPEHPYTHKQEIMSDDEMARVMMRNTILLGDKINGSTNGGTTNTNNS